MVKITGIDHRHIKSVGCNMCASALEYTQSEVTHSSVSDYGGGSDNWNYIVCPKCSHKVTVK